MPKKATTKKPAKKTAPKKIVKKAIVKKAAPKKVAKKPTTKKVTAKKAVKKAAPKKIKVIAEAYRKTQIIEHIAQDTDLTKKQVTGVFDSLNNLIAAHLKKNGAGVFALPGVAKFRTVRKPATKARKGTNPFTGEKTTFKAKPARTLIKIRALKKIKNLL